MLKTSIVRYCIVALKHYFGLNQFKLSRERIEAPVYYEPERLINGHLLICGQSGTGKSWQSKRLLTSAALAGLKVDVIDVHEELGQIPGARRAKYSQQTNYGYNPLVLDCDPHSGGVDRQAEIIVNLIKEVTPAFGVRQETVLRSLIIDTYQSFGIFQNNQASWRRKTITDVQRREIIGRQAWSELRSFYPTLDDLLKYAERKVTNLMIGGDNKATVALQSLTRSVSALYKANGKYSKTPDTAERAKLESQVISNRQKCIDNYCTFIANLETGREIEDIIKYDSVEILSSVINRINLLNSAGVFKSNPPPFADAKVRIHEIKSLTNDQQILFVKLRLREIFEQCKQQGTTATGQEIRQIIFVDEAHKFFHDNKSDDIISVLAKESRKFGIALWLASQSPTEFPEDFLTNVGTTILLGIHPNYWKRAASMLRVAEESLKFIKPQEVLSVKMSRTGIADPRFTNVFVPHPGTDEGRRASNHIAKRVA